MKENKIEETDGIKEFKEQSEDETGEQMRWVKITKVDIKVQANAWWGF